MSLAACDATRRPSGFRRVWSCRSNELRRNSVGFPTVLLLCHGLLAAFLPALAVTPVCAQVTQPVAAVSLGPRITPQSFTGLEDRVNTTLTSLNPKDPPDLLGSTRALYLPDYGVVMTSELSLVLTPGPTPFRREGFTKEEIARMRERKLAQIPLLKKSMREAMKTAAMLVASTVGMQYQASRLQVVFAVRLLYLKWEDTTSLPAQIVMSASLKNAMAGEVREDVQ